MATTSGTPRGRKPERPSTSTCPIRPIRASWNSCFTTLIRRARRIGKRAALRGGCSCRSVTEVWTFDSSPRVLYEDPNPAQVRSESPPSPIGPQNQWMRNASKGRRPHRPPKVSHANTSDLRCAKAFESKSLNVLVVMIVGRRLILLPTSKAVAGLCEDAPVFTHQPKKFENTLRQLRENCEFGACDAGNSSRRTSRNLLIENGSPPVQSGREIPLVSLTLILLGFEKPSDCVSYRQHTSRTTQMVGKETRRIFERVPFGQHF
jgi:hypothetical protein